MRPNLLRLVLAYCAALASIVLCAMRGHVHIEFLHPASYLSAFQHRCGLVMIACVCWAGLEMLLMAAEPVSATPANR